MDLILRPNQLCPRSPDRANTIARSTSGDASSVCTRYAVTRPSRRGAGRLGGLSQPRCPVHDQAIYCIHNNRSCSLTVCPPSICSFTVNPVCSLLPCAFYSVCSSPGWPSPRLLSTHPLCSLPPSALPVCSPVMGHRAGSHGAGSHGAGILPPSLLTQ